MSQVLQAKADQVPEFREALLNSKEKVLVECVKNETFWASGLDSQNTLHIKRQFWLGKNRLGEMLSELRENIEEKDKEMKKVRSQQRKGSNKSDRRQLRSTSHHKDSKGTHQRRDAASFMQEETDYDSGSEATDNDKAGSTG